MRWLGHLVVLWALTGCASAQELAAIGAEAGRTPVNSAQLEGRYRVSGERALRPMQISDDGLRTYIVWSETQDLPAVFAVTALGAEEMVDGYMRGDVFTIDRIHQRLVFRIDRKLAKAERVVARAEP